MNEELVLHKRSKLYKQRKEKYSPKDMFKRKELFTKREDIVWRPSWIKECSNRIRKLERRLKISIKKGCLEGQIWLQCRKGSKV